MFKSTTLLLIYIFIVISVSAQTDSLTIQEAVKSAHDRNAELQQWHARLRQKKEVWRSQTGVKAPEISYFKEGIGSGPGDIFDEKRITLSQSVDFPLTTSYRLKGLSEEVKALEYQIAMREREIKSEIKSYYVEVIYALRLKESRENQLRLAQELYNAVFTKFETGMANGIDLANVELQLESSKNDLDQTEWILHKARYNLFFAIGLPVEDQHYGILFTDTLSATDIEIGQIFALAGQDIQPAFLASEHELTAAGFFLKEAKSSFLPDFRVNLYLQDLGTGYKHRGFEVGFTIPLWATLENKGMIRTSMARLDEIKWKQNEIRLDMKRQIEHAWHNYDVSRTIVKRYLSSMQSKAVQLQNMSLRAYQLGETDLLHLINARQTFLMGEERYLAAMRDYYLQLISLEKYLENDLVY